MYYLEQVEKYIQDSDIDLKSRKQEHLFRRYYLINFLRKKTCLSSTRIGKVFGKDHATVLNSLKVMPYIENRFEYIQITLELSQIFPMFSPFENEFIPSNQAEIPNSLLLLQTQFLKSHGIN